MSRSSRAQRAIAVACTAFMVCSTRGEAPTHDDAIASTQTHEPVSVEIYEEPKPKQIYRINCGLAFAADSPWSACAQLSEGMEGWVSLAFMVDSRGQPFEVTVFRSTGNKAFEQEAKRAIERSTFVPASLNGKPIEGSYELTYRFQANPFSPPQATPAFVRSYDAIMAAIKASDRTAADAALKQVKITNLSEDAYFWLARYSYARKWSDEFGQVWALERAIADADDASYLREDAFREALLACLQLEVQVRHYAEALKTWARLSKFGVDKTTEAQITPVIEQLKQLRADNRSYDMQGQMPDGRWYLGLFKRHFAAVVSEGYISQVKLWCEKGHVSLPFDPKLQYETPGRYGTCSIELEGAPGTRFKLIQF